MAAPTINQIREAIKTRLEGIAGTQVSAYVLGNPTFPSLQVVSGEITYDETVGTAALKGYEFKVQAMVGAVTDIGAQKLLGEYSDSTGSKSVFATIGADHTLGGVVQHADVVSASEEKIYELPNGSPTIGREWILEVIAAGA